MHSQAIYQLEHETISTGRNASESLDEKQIEPFRFLDLPTELRLRIYELLLVYWDDITIRRDYTRNQQESSHLKAVRCLHLKCTHFGCREFGCRHFECREFGFRHFECRDIGANSKTFASNRYPIGFALLWTCRLVHNEAAHTLYSKNTFSFDSDGGFVNFVHFEHCLTNQSSLRSLTFHPMEVFYSQWYTQYALSECAHAALKAINRLPNLRMTAFTAHTNLPLDSLTMITMICRALRDTKCSLILQRPKKCAPSFIYWARCYNRQGLPKIHYSVLATLVEYGWEVINDYEVIDTPGLILHNCH